jgi:hypothetical protein
MGLGQAVKQDVPVEVEALVEHIFKDAFRIKDEVVLTMTALDGERTLVRLFTGKGVISFQITEQLWDKIIDFHTRQRAANAATRLEPPK